MHLRVLHIEDNADDSLLIQETLRTAGIEPRIERIERAEQLDEALRRGGVDLVLSDYKLPKFDGLTALDVVRSRAPDLPFIMVTGSLGDESAVEVIKRGASDFVIKENLRRLKDAVLRALREAEERRVRRIAERRQRLLMRELDHRVKNNLASVIGLCEEMLREARSLDEFGRKFTGRLHNIARLQEALAQSNWEGASLRDLVWLTVGPVAREAAERLELVAPERIIPASTASTLSMVLYELAANAVEHGALAAPQGRVEVRWDEHAGGIRLTWRERGGAAPAGSVVPGGGMQLIEGFIRHELGGAARFDYAPEGLVLVAEFPVPVPAAAPEMAAP